MIDMWWTGTRPTRRMTSTRWRRSCLGYFYHREDGKSFSHPQTVNGRGELECLLVAGCGTASKPHLLHYSQQDLDRTQKFSWNKRVPKMVSVVSVVLITWMFVQGFIFLNNLDLIDHLKLMIDSWALRAIGQTAVGAGTRARREGVLRFTLFRQTNMKLSAVKRVLPVAASSTRPVSSC